MCYELSHLQGTKKYVSVHNVRYCNTNGFDLFFFNSFYSALSFLQLWETDIKSGFLARVFARGHTAYLEKRGANPGRVFEIKDRTEMWWKWQMRSNCNFWETTETWMDDVTYKKVEKLTLLLKSSCSVWIESCSGALMYHFSLSKKKRQEQRCLTPAFVRSLRTQKNPTKCTITTIIMVYSWQVKYYCQVRWELASYIYLHFALPSCCFKIKPELVLLFFSSYGPYLTTMNNSVHNQCVRTFPPCVEFINLYLNLKMHVWAHLKPYVCTECSGRIKKYWQKIWCCSSNEAILTATFILDSWISKHSISNII